MGWVGFLFAGIMVYIAVAVFIIGSAYKIYRWWKTPRSPVRLGMFPRPRSNFGRGLKLAKDSLIFPQVLDNDRVMWFFVITLHLVAVGTFIGHLRLFGEFQPLVNVIGSQNMDTLSFIGGGTAGVVLLAAVLFLLFRRFKSPYRELSVPADYYLLFLILFIIIFGDHLRFVAPFHASDYQAYMASLVRFSPSFPQEIAESGSKWVLISHVFTANLLLIYFPFSKLVHFVSGFAGNLIRSDVWPQAQTSKNWQA